MADPVLLAHLVAPNSFELGGLSPTSIRDQMVRARMLIDRALDARLIDSAARSLLVVGAGVAGATAAVRAAERGVAVLVIEAEPIPFFRQANCRTRWVDPTQYDWPVGHWQRGRFPWTAPNMPLPWNADFANTLALAWTRAFNRHQQRHFPRLLVLYRTTLSGYPAFIHPRRGGVVQVHLTSGGMVSPALDFGMMVLSRSYGTENTTVNGYTGFEFWDTDPFVQPNFGLPAETPANVLISGAGDGALQDFLRIMTGGKSAKEIFNLVFDPTEPKWTTILATLRDSEDQAQRAYSWGEQRHHDHDVIGVLQRAHEDAIDELANNRSIWRTIKGRLDWLITSIGSPPDVILVHRCTHFASNYPLNRFLVLLLKRYLDLHHHGSVTFRPNERVVDVTGISPHTCANRPMACHGQSHRVVVEPADCGGPLGLPWVDNQTYNIVIVRHGARPYASPLPPVSRPRQILPYHAPA